MRLKDRNTSPVGGLWYEYQDDKGNTYRVNGYDTTWRTFMAKVRSHMASNNVKIPEDLEIWIEDQICQRQPAGKCWKQSGDRLATAIHSVTTVADKAATALGITVNLTKKAKGCNGCNKRRVAMNKKLG